ncbi:hypothetical protein DMB92_05535 [Campylobacter sp. MIT 99-7217]|uniref:hypothetical protein n=1 Tax=Campylobacter sp. MIT 99-7217 TaxID=535091 RepID=UPI0011571919|nr:hypothetical protein [Campylobacter sp. MIT 99-7217]TQR31848.1 hypothetical protein DMB92_05535 [Campylobacter sp. MIT 99-7217]
MANWLSEFKLALIEEDIAKIELLLDKPEYSQNDVGELIQAKSLIDEANRLISNKKNTLATEMQKAKRAKEYTRI